jgi:hypothetical protein
MIRPNKNAWLWWVCAVTLSIGVAIYILLKPSVYDPEIQKYRSMALIGAFLVSGLSIIIATSKRWFGKDL